MNDKLAATWDDVPVLAEPPGDGYYELTENGWGALIGWYSGVDRMVRCRENRVHMITEVCIDKSGTTRRRTGPRTAEDQQTIDDGANDYLRAAGVPTRPGGWRWFAELPEGYTDTQIEDLVTAGVGRLPADLVHPSEVAPTVREIVESVYNRSTSQRGSAAIGSSRAITYGRPPTTGPRPTR